MGALQAAEMAALTDLDTALSWHLQRNHYPPVPLSMLQPCKDAITAYQDGEGNREIALRGATYKGRSTAPAIEIIRAHHLDAFLRYADD